MSLSTGAGLRAGYAARCAFSALPAAPPGGAALRSHRAPPSPWPDTRQDAVRGAAEAALEQGKSVVAAAGASAVRDGELQSPDTGAEEGEGAAADAATESDIEEGNVAVSMCVCGLAGECVRTVPASLC